MKKNTKKLKSLNCNTFLSLLNEYIRTETKTRELSEIMLSMRRMGMKRWMKGVPKFEKIRRIDIDRSLRKMKENRKELKNARA